MSGFELIGAGKFTGSGQLPASALGSLTEFVLFSTAIPFIIPSSGSMGNNGALSGLTALPATYANAYIWMAAGQIASGSAAGWYYCVMSGTQAGTVYNNTYTSGQPTIPASPTAFVTTGPGAFTGLASGNTIGPTFALPAKTLGKRDTLRFSARASFTNNANVKAIYLEAGSTVLWQSNTTSNLSDSLLVDVTAREATNSQLCVANGTVGVALITSAFVYTTVDFTAAQNLSFQGNKATATDNIVLEAIIIELLKGS